jgi:hypothetical protein
MPAHQQQQQHHHHKGNNCNCNNGKEACASTATTPLQQGQKPIAMAAKMPVHQ